MKNKKKIAIVGAGFFGCTIALVLSKKYEVDLYERKPDIYERGLYYCINFFHE